MILSDRLFLLNKENKMQELDENNNQPLTKGRELSKKITQHIEELAKATDAARLSEEMLRYMGTIAKFHKYSMFNVWLILTQKPEATYIAGFHQWQKLKRWVKRGERGIPILAPILSKEDPTDPDSQEVVKGYKPVHVFDVSQTDGEPLPEPPDWKSPEKNEELTKKLMAYAQSQKIQIFIRNLSKDTQGVSKGGVIELDPSAGTKTLIHEIAHELMHRDKDRPLEKGIRELEAESVAYVVGKHFGLEELSSPNYIAMHGATSGRIFEHLERIRSISAMIITTLEKN
jgi:hypothetical protein